MKIASLICGLVGVTVLSGVVQAQSLADVARKEEERRKAIKTPSKVLTNEDLRRYPVSDLPAAVQEKPVQAPEEPQQGAKAAADAAGTPAGEAPPSVEKGEAYWRKLITDARSQLDRSKSYLEALQVRANALTAEYYQHDDPAQRTVIWNQRAKILDDIDRLNVDIAQQTKAVAKIEEDARRANVPPGWLR